MKNLDLEELKRNYICVDKDKGCWLWQGTKSHGYGRINSGKLRTSAHRFFYESYIGRIPEGMCVCHVCDVPHCVNPNHLWLGTCSDNQQDAKRKGRMPNGEWHYSRLYPEKVARGNRHSSYLHPELILRGNKHPAAKLTEVDIPEIFRLRSAGLTQTAIAEKFAVRVMTINDVLQHRTWRHVSI